MMKKTVKIGLHILIVLMSVLIFYNVYSQYLDSRIEELYTQCELSVNHVSGLAEKDKGNVLIKHSMAAPNILLMGSSELGSPVPENPKNLFPNNLYAGDISCVGHASVQNALHAINLGANFEAVAGDNIVIVESLQWFAGTEISPEAFFSNFSELQFYEFLHNDKISEVNKEYLCKRYIQLENYSEIKLYPQIDTYVSGNRILEGINGLLFENLENAGYSLADGDLTFPQTYILARLYSSESVGEKVIYQLLRPYYWMRYKFLQLKDKYDAYQWLKKLNGDVAQEEVKLDWEQIYRNGKSEGITACTNNNLYVYDDYYTKYLQENYESWEGRDREVPFLISNEWNDFEFFLKVCKDLELKPYIVSMSTNGWYYDYIGVDEKKRGELYDKIEMLSGQYGMSSLSLKDKEYEPYFYCDVMHLGWKGWPYVVENIIEYYSK